MTFWTVVLILGGIWLFIEYPKQIIIGIGCIVALGFLIYVSTEIQDTKNRKERELTQIKQTQENTRRYIVENDLLANVKIFVTYSVGRETCPKEFPLLVVYENLTDRTINFVGVKFSAYKQGYSNNVIKTGSYYKKEGYRSVNVRDNEKYESHKIIEPKKSHISCFRLPEFQENETIDPKTLSYKAYAKRIEFSNGYKIGDWSYNW